MAKAKKGQVVAEPEEVETEAPEALEEAVPEVAPVGIPASAPGGPVPGRKSLGVKEPIVFKWKVVGRVGHTIVTLFKSVEREEVEAQLARLTGDGYYTELQILEASAKVEQPPQPKEPKKSAKVKEPPKPADKSSSGKKAAKSTPSKKPAPKAEKASAKSSKAKAKPSAKRTVKKK